MFDYTADDFGISKLSTKRNNEAARMNKALALWVYGASDSVICSEVGISQTTLWKYRKNPQFLSFYNENCQEWFKALQGKAIKTLNALLDKNNFNAAKYVLDNNAYALPAQIELDSANVININIVDGDDE